jgi:diaminopimelate decarboxylase
MSRPCTLGGIPAEDLAAAYDTPLYVYDGAVMRRRWDALTGGIQHRPLGIYYSCKANAAVGIVRFLVGLGARVDACSPGDLAVARRAGALGTDVGYVGVGVSDADLDAVVASGAFFVADSLAQVDRYADRCDGRGTEIGLRVNCDVAAGFHAHVQAGAWDAKFGLQPPQLADALVRAAARGLRVVGLHSHIGSDILTPEPHLTLLSRLLELSDDLPDVRFIDIGGGWGTPFAAGDREYPVRSFGRAATALLQATERRRARPLELRIEPGAYLVMDAGVLLTRVTEMKPPVELDGRSTAPFVCVDTSYNHVVSAVIYDTYHPIELARHADAPVDAQQRVHVVGNLMQAGDVIARDRALPAGVQVGDVLVIRKCGGYSSSRATIFNERPRPAEVLVERGAATLIRRPETAEDLLSRDL